MLLFDGGESCCARLQRVDGKVNEKHGVGEATQAKWLDVILPVEVPKDPIWVINVADCLSELSQGELPSTLHRVMPDGGDDPRSSLALFMGLDPRAELKLQDCTTTYEDWRKQRILRSQEILRASQIERETSS